VSGPGRTVIWEAEDEHVAGTRLPKPTVYALLALSILILGANWPIQVTALESISPIWFAALRLSGAGIVVTIIAVASNKAVVPPRRDVPMILTVALVRMATVMVLVFYALRMIPAGRASVLVWTSALWTVPIAAVFLGHRMSSRKWFGLLVGLGGVIIISEVWSNDWRERDVIVGTLLLITGAWCNAATSVKVRHHRWTINPLQALPWQFASASIPLLILAIIVDGWPSIDWTPRLALIMVYQTCIASGLAFWAQLVVLRNLSPVTTNPTMMGVPVVGVVSSAIFLDEAIETALAIGMMFVLAGVTINLLADRVTPAAGRE
jgi:drug/metabolite transporter (DMT)-like permease